MSADPKDWNDAVRQVQNPRTAADEAWAEEARAEAIARECLARDVCFLLLHRHGMGIPIGQSDLQLLATLYASTERGERYFKNFVGDALSGDGIDGDQIWADAAVNPRHPTPRDVAAHFKVTLADKAAVGIHAIPAIDAGSGGAEEGPRIEAEPPSEHQANATARPTILLADGELLRILNEIQEAILADDAGPMLFDRGGLLAHLQRTTVAGTQGGIRRSSGALTIMVSGREWLRLRMAHAAGFVRYDARSKREIPKDPSLELASALGSAVGMWRFPSLLAVVEAPTMRPDGTILDRPGYDPA